MLCWFRSLLDLLLFHKRLFFLKIKWNKWIKLAYYDSVRQKERLEEKKKKLLWIEETKHNTDLEKEKDNNVQNTNYFLEKQN